MTPRSGILAMALIFTSSTATADVDSELSRLLEQNASSAAYARICDEEPLWEQLKANTMMLLAVTGMEAHNVQPGSGKFNDICGVRSPTCARPRPWTAQRRCGKHASVSPQPGHHPWQPTQRAFRQLSLCRRTDC
jgi:hypothetical protein